LSELVDYSWLTGPEAGQLLTELASDVAPLHSQLHRLRKLFGMERARLAVEQVRLRKRAVAKFGQLAERMFFTDLALQQATDLWIGRYKASRFPEGLTLIDYCTGIGGDLLALAGRGPVVGWDNAPEMSLLAEANLRTAQGDKSSEVRTGDVSSQTPLSEDCWHVDPDRRVDSRRSTQLRRHSPGPDVIERWRATAPQGVVKLAPATEVPELWQREAELEWVSRDRQCRQQLAWFGQLAAAPGKHRATIIHKAINEDAPLTVASFAGDPALTAHPEPQVCDYIYDTDPAIRAAGLTGALAEELEMSAITTGASYLSTDRPIDHRLVSRFRVLELMPLREKTLANYLRSLGIGRLEIKKRGIQRDPEKLRRSLKLKGEATATILLTRQGDREIAILAERCQTEDRPTG